MQATLGQQLFDITVRGVRGVTEQRKQLSVVTDGLTFGDNRPRFGSYLKGILADVAKYSDFMPYTKESRVLPQDAQLLCIWMFFGDLNGYEILIAQSVDNKDFCGKLCH